MHISYCISLESAGPTIEGEVTKQGRDEVESEAQADADIGDPLHPHFTGSETQSHLVIQISTEICKVTGIGLSPVELTVDGQHCSVAQEGEGHSGNGIGAL